MQRCVLQILTQSQRAKYWTTEKLIVGNIYMHDLGLSIQGDVWICDVNNWIVPYTNPKQIALLDALVFTNGLLYFWFIFMN